MKDRDDFYMDQAKTVARDSDDRSRQTGAVIVKDGHMLISGSNKFPNGVDANIDERHERPVKYLWIEHAERNGFYYAAKHGIALNGSTMFLMWFPCAPCARGLIQCGIVRLVCCKPDKSDKKWGDDFIVAEKMLREANVEIKFI